MVPAIPHLKDSALLLTQERYGISGCVYDPTRMGFALLAALSDAGIHCEYVTELDALEGILNRISIDSLIFFTDLQAPGHRHELEYLSDLLGAEHVRVYSTLQSSTSCIRDPRGFPVLPSIQALQHWLVMGDDPSEEGETGEVGGHLVNGFRESNAGENRRFSLVRRLISRVRSLTDENAALRREIQQLRKEALRHRETSAAGPPGK